jgi:hypothetical protein
LLCYARGQVVTEKRTHMFGHQSVLEMLL